MAIKQGLVLVGDIGIGRSAFMEKMGVASELEYKRQCIKNKQIMYHAHIGMNTWQDTVEALTRLYRAAEDSGFVMDRAGICLDRRMGLPPEHRKRIPADQHRITAGMPDLLKRAALLPLLEVFESRPLDFICSAR